MNYDIDDAESYVVSKHHLHHLVALGIATAEIPERC